MNVKVIDYQGKGIANAVVVLGNNSGTVVSFASTDALGAVSFNSAPPNAMVTAAFSCYEPSEDRTYYSVDSVQQVNVPAVTLTLGTCGQGSMEVNINVTEAVPGITEVEATLGPITYGGHHSTIGVYELQDDGNISVFAVGYDDSGVIKGYGYALDKPAVNGSAIDVVIDRTDLVQHTHHFANVPSSTLSYYAFGMLLRKHAFTSLPFNFADGTAPLPDGFTTYSSSGYGDNNLFGAAVMLDQDGDGKSDAGVGLVRYLATAADQIFDFSSTPLVPFGFTYDPGTSGRPVITWMNSDPRSTAQMLTISYRTNTPQRVAFYHHMTVPATSAGLVYPELPDQLSAFRPAQYDELSLQTLKFDTSKSYSDYLNAIVSQKGRFYDAAGFNSYSYAGISRVP